MNKQLIANSLCYHGQPLLKIWEGERGSELENIGIVNPDFSVYNFRQKNLTFQDRAKRLKLHQFLAKNAEDLFCINVIGSSVKKKWSYDTNENSNNPVSFSMPPFECFIKKEVERSKYVHSTLSTLNKGDLVYCVVTSKTSAGIFVKPLCTGNQTLRILEDLNLKSFIPTQNLVKLDRKGNELTYAVQDYITCDVIDVSADAERITLGMLYDEKLHKTSPFGIIAPNNLPEYYKKSMSHPQSMYHEFLQQDKNFKNSESFESIGEELGIDSNELFTNIKSLKIPFPAQEYASDLRQAQASKWAFRSVADGIEHFKEGRHTEAFQCLNKALSIDPRNVEGLVARGALYANSSNFHKAINDFETSLKLNFYHINARKYLSETLVALGRSYEDENNFEEALKAYQNCLNISPNHEEAKNSLENLKVRFDLAIVESKRDIPKMKMETLGSKKANDLKGEVGKQPYYLSILENDKSDYDKKVQSFIDVAKDDDDYESRVRKLLLEASKYQKERQKTSSSSSSNYKEKEKKKKKKSKKESKKPKEYDIGNAQLAEALKILKTIPIPNLESEKSLTEGLRKCEADINNINKMTEFTRREPPAAPQISRAQTPPIQSFVPDKVPVRAPPPPKIIEKPVVVPKPPQQIVLDKFGCFRLAVAPELEQNRNRSLSRGRNSPLRRSRSPNFRRRRSRSGSFRRDRRRRSRSPYFRGSPPRRRFSRSRRRRTPSPFDIRRVPRDREVTPDRRISRSRSPRGGFRGSRTFRQRSPSNQPI